MESYADPTYNDPTPLTQIQMTSSNSLPSSNHSHVFAAIFAGFRSDSLGDTTPATLITPICTPSGPYVMFRLCTRFRWAALARERANSCGIGCSGKAEL